MSVILLSNNRPLRRSLKNHMYFFSNVRISKRAWDQRLAGTVKGIIPVIVN